MLSGNTITVLIMQRKEFRETFHRLLIALAVFDNIFIIAALFTLIIRYVLLIDKSSHNDIFFRTFSLLDYSHLRFLSHIFMGMITTASFSMFTSIYLTLAIRYYTCKHVPMVNG